MKRLSVLKVLLSIGVLLIFCQSGYAERAKVALIAVNNYSGVDKIGGSKMENLIPDLLVKNLQKQSGIEFWETEETENAVKKAGMEVYYEASNLCNPNDLARLGKKIGVAQVATLEINGYNEISREKAKKSYQLLLALKVVDSSTGLESVYVGEGFGDGNRDAALENAVIQLSNNFLNLQGNDPSTGNLRNASVPVIGNKSRKLYHLQQTHHQPKPENSVNFANRAEAEQNGFSPCPICFPGYKSFDYSDRNIEESLGSEACGQIEYSYRLEQNPELLKWINRVAAPLIADTMRKNRDYKFRILDTDEVNAFASPNGYIYITKGLLDCVESNDELAFVIAHEMGHLEKKHSVIAYKKALAASFFAAILIGAANNNNSTVTLATVVMMNLIMRGYSREQEREADQVALIHLKRTGLEQQVYLTLFGRFIDMREHKIYGINKIFATHPTPEARIDYLDKSLQAYNDLQTRLAN